MAGFRSGAYVNHYEWDTLVSFEDGGYINKPLTQAGFILEAIKAWGSHPAPTVKHARIHSDRLCILQDAHAADGSDGREHNLLYRCETSGGGTAYRVAEGTKAMRVDLVECLHNGVDFEPSDIELVNPAPGSRWRGQRRDGTAWQLYPDGTVESIPTFWSG